MQEDMLHKAIHSFGSIKNMAKKLGIHREHIYAWINGVSKIPLEYALQIECLTQGEIHWRDLVPAHIVQRLKDLTLILPKFDLPPCELLYVAIARIKSSNIENFCEENIRIISLYQERPICVDTENRLIFGEKTLYNYKKQDKKTIPAWRISLANLAKGNYLPELFVKNFFISERVAIGIALEKFLGNRQGYRSDLVEKENCKVIKNSDLRLQVSCKDSPMNNDAQVASRKRITKRQLIANYLGFVSHFTYQNAKKIKLNGNVELIDRINQRQLSISKGAMLCKLSHDEQINILTNGKNRFFKRSSESLNDLPKNSQSI